MLRTYIDIKANGINYVPWETIVCVPIFATAANPGTGRKRR